MNNSFILSNRQLQKLEEVIHVFYARAVERQVFDGPIILLLNSVKQAIIDRESLDQYQIDVVIWMIEAINAQMEEDEYDPQLEQVYFKLAGWWPTDRPWFTRVKSSIDHSPNP